MAKLLIAVADCDVHLWSVVVGQINYTLVSSSIKSHSDDDVDYRWWRRVQQVPGVIRGVDKYIAP